MTPQHHANLGSWSQKWINECLAPTTTDWGALEAALKTCYEIARKTYPGTIFRMQSPLAWACTAFLTSGKRVDAPYYESDWPQLSHETQHRIRRELIGPIVDALDVPYDLISAKVCDEVSKAFHVDGTCERGRIANQFLTADNLWLSPAVYTFLRRAGVIDLSPRQCCYLDSRVKISCMVSYLSFRESHVIACARPTKLMRNNNGRVHCTDGKAIEFPDGWGVYALHGVRFPEDLFKKVTSGRMPLNQVLAIKNIDQRAQALRFANVPKLIEQLKGEKLDEVHKLATNGKIIKWKLYRFPESSIFPAGGYYVLMDCPSTGKQHFEGVAPCKTVAEAMAWAELNLITPEQWMARVPLQDET